MSDDRKALVEKLTKWLAVAKDRRGWELPMSRADVETVLALIQPAAAAQGDAVAHMVNRFLSWRLPENFHPDAGISFKAAYNEQTPWPAKHEPVGTNLFSAEQAEAMVRHMLDGLPAAPPSAQGVGREPTDEQLADSLPIVDALSEWYEAEKLQRRARGGSSGRPPTVATVRAIVREFAALAAQGEQAGGEQG